MKPFLRNGLESSVLDHWTALWFTTSSARRGHCKKERDRLFAQSEKRRGTNNFSGLLPNSSTALHLVMASRIDDDDDERARWEAPIMIPTPGPKYGCLRIKPNHSYTIPPPRWSKTRIAFNKRLSESSTNLLSCVFFVHIKTSGLFHRQA